MCFCNYSFLCGSFLPLCQSNFPKIVFEHAIAEFRLACKKKNHFRVKHRMCVVTFNFIPLVYNDLFNVQFLEGKFCVGLLMNLIDLKCWMISCVRWLSFWLKTIFWNKPWRNKIQLYWLIKHSMWFTLFDWYMWYNSNQNLFFSERYV